MLRAAALPVRQSAARRVREARAGSRSSSVENLVNRAVVASKIVNERGDEILAQAVRVVHVLHIEDVAGMLAVQRCDELAAVQLCVGKRWHLEVDPEHVLCARDDRRITVGVNVPRKT